MKSLKSFIGILLAMVLAALSSVAASQQYSKLYTIAVTPSSTALTMVVDIGNASLSPGNSNINLIYFTITGAKIDTVTTVPASSFTIDNSSPANVSTVTFNLAKPLQAKKHFVATIKLKDCGELISIVQADDVGVWTGSGGQRFQPVDPGVFPFTPSIVCLTLACGEGGVTPSGIPLGGATVNRGVRNKDGSNATNATACAGLPVTYTRYFDTNEAWFEWAATGSQAAWAFTIVSAGSVPEPGTTGIAWLRHSDGGFPATIDDAEFVTGNDLLNPTALNCIAPVRLPTPYGTVATTFSATDVQVIVNVSVPAGEVIGHAASWDAVFGEERISFNNSVSQGPGKEKWFVAARHVGGTLADSHLAGTLAMSTSTPILTVTVGDYAADTQAKGCIAAQEDLPGGGHSTTFHDYGDIITSHP